MKSAPDEQVAIQKEKRLRVLAVIGVILCAIILIGGFLLQRSLDDGSSSSSSSHAADTEPSK